MLVNFWHDKQNQRNEVIHLAKQSGFDPLIADNWYLWNPIMAKKLVKFFKIQKLFCILLILCAACISCFDILLWQPNQNNTPSISRYWS